MTEPTGEVVEWSSKRPLKGYTAQRLMRELAVSGKLQSTLAKEYNVTQGAISIFKIKHSQEIKRISENAADEYAGLWIASKLNRLAEMQSLAEELIGLDITTSTAAEIRNLLKAAAEELGDIPNKSGVNVNVSTARYEIANVDLGDLT